jgi:cytochrome c oxidase assembly factor CtaG
VATLRWTDWNGDPATLAALILTALLYVAVLRRFPARGRQMLSFWAGWGSLALAVLSPLDAGAAYLFTLHMVQHMILLMVAPPLLALGIPPSFLGWMYLRPPLRRVLRFLWAPLPALVLYNGALILWHLPVAYDAALRSPWIHALEHVSFVGAGVVFWGVIVSPAPQLVRASFGLRLALVMAADVVNFVLGWTLASTGGPPYAPYTQVGRLWGLSPLDDVRLGGALMWVMGQMMYALPVLLLLSAILWGTGGRGERPGVPSAAHRSL